MQERRVSVLLVGIGGYGQLYVDGLKEWQRKGIAGIVAVVDPMAELSSHWPELSAAGTPCFDTIEAFVETGIRADLAIISSPIAFHAVQSVAALSAGINVLCEKPMASTLEGALCMRDARDASGRFIEIGYDWSFGAAIRRLKADVLSGHLGAPRRLRTWVAWPRGSGYYARNDWAGRIRDGRGQWVCDSPANNATAHFLHNMLYVIGPAAGSSATPLAITGECYRANPIESFDACCCRIETAEKAEIFFFTAQCVKNRIGPVFRFEFENAVVEYEGHGDIVARFADGATRSYGDPGIAPMAKLHHALDMCRAPERQPEVCGPEAAMAQTLCIHGLHQTPPHDFPPDCIVREPSQTGEILTWVPGLEEAMRLGFERGALFSEMGLPWAVESRRVAAEQGVSFRIER